MAAQEEGDDDMGTLALEEEEEEDLPDTLVLEPTQEERGAPASDNNGELNRTSPGKTGFNLGFNRNLG